MNRALFPILLFMSLHQLAMAGNPIIDVFRREPVEAKLIRMMPKWGDYYKNIECKDEKFISADVFGQFGFKAPRISISYTEKNTAILYAHGCRYTLKGEKITDVVQGVARSCRGSKDEYLADVVTQWAELQACCKKTYPGCPAAVQRFTNNYLRDHHSKYAFEEDDIKISPSPKALGDKESL
jgi:hypothetical protein